MENAIDFKIEEGVLLKCRHCIENVTIPDCVTRIGKNVFKSCENLKSIILPDHLKSIRDNAFNHCKKLIEVVIPEGGDDSGKHENDWGWRF